MSEFGELSLKDRLQLMRIKEELQPTEEKLATQKSIKVFNHGLRQYIAQVSTNQVYIMTASEFQVIDVLRSPKITSRIECFDVAEVSKDIVCYSTLSVEG